MITPEHTRYLHVMVILVPALLLGIPALTAAVTTVHAAWHRRYMSTLLRFMLTIVLLLDAVMLYKHLRLETAYILASEARAAFESTSAFAPLDGSTSQLPMPFDWHVTPWFTGVNFAAFGLGMLLLVALLRRRDRVEQSVLALATLSVALAPLLFWVTNLFMDYDSPLMWWQNALWIALGFCTTALPILVGSAALGRYERLASVS